MMKIEKNFYDHELSCPHCNKLVYDAATMRKLQSLRDTMGRAFKVNSFYRCREYNDSLANSAEDSQHLYGKAIDIDWSGWPSAIRWKMISEAIALGFSLGIYAKHLHLDDRHGDPRLWVGSY